MTEPLPPDLRWVAFDLDDTLHDFRRASASATDAAFGAIDGHVGIGTGDLGAAYGEILDAARCGHFTEPKSAREYRGERFGALLRRFGVDPGPHLERVLEAYDAALGEALALRPGALGALRATKRAGLLVMVVSEGPRDAQETTIERLGLAPSIDLLVTSTGEGAAEGRRLVRAGAGARRVRTR